jgi:hypothetical protein
MPKQIVHETLISKITRAKWTGDVAQAVEHLLCKCEVLSPNPSPIQKQKEILSFAITWMNLENIVLNEIARN